MINHKQGRFKPLGRLCGKHFIETAIFEKVAVFFYDAAANRFMLELA
jgi:hypothetical protein